MGNKDKALALAGVGLHVFPVGANGQPLTPNGFYAGTVETDAIEKMWSDSPDAGIGVWCGASGIVALDVDVKNGKDGWESLENNFYAPDATFNYTSRSGEGAHFIYAAPEGSNLPPCSRYRGLDGIDRRSGGSYVIWSGEVPQSRDEFAKTPNWFQDASEVRSAAAFEGTVKDWFDTLEPGEPNVLVRKAMRRIQDKYAEQGNDLTHGDIIEAQHEAIRLGAEANPGVQELLALIEELTLSREGEHSRDPEEWAYEFAEGLSSGIRKYGDAIELRKNLPDFSMSLIPDTVIDTLVTGDPGGKDEFNALLAALVRDGVPPDVTTSIMWSAPRTKRISREWGLEFVHKRVLDAQTVTPPTRENPALESPQLATKGTAILTEDQMAEARMYPSFVDEYVGMSKKTKGWTKEEFSVPAAWTLLSAAFGGQAVVPVGTNLPVNLWFITLGESGTGKTVHWYELSNNLDLLLRNEDEVYFNLGANSSPEAMHETLLERDGKVSGVFGDEASDFFEGLNRRDWLSGVKDRMADWYSGRVPPRTTKSLKEHKGKSARTSFQLTMWATPDRMMQHISTAMFESGFLARVNWTWCPPPVNTDARYRVNRYETDDHGVNPMWYAVIADLVQAKSMFPGRVVVDWTDEAEDLLVEAHRRMDKVAHSRDRYSVTEPAVTRLKETAWKCAALTALYRGSHVIERCDALVALSYVQRWFNDLFRVVDAAGQGEFAERMDEMLVYIQTRKEGATHAKLLYDFRRYAKFSMKEVDNVIDGLLRSGRINRVPDTNPVRYVANGG